MKRFLQLTIILLAAALSSVNAQDLENGDIAIELNDYGKVRVFAPDFTLRQIDRFSILVGGNPNEVFDYLNDQESVDTARTVTPPTYGDIELYVGTDYMYSGLPPFVGVNINVYGWNSGGYALAKYTVENQETAALNAKVGFEIIPQIDGAYGFESIEYLPDHNVTKIYKGNFSSVVGFKILDRTMTTLKSFDWYDGYNGSDTDLYTWLNHGQIDTLFESSDSGAVSIMGVPAESLDPNATTEVYVGIATGADEAEMLANMDSVTAKYEALVTSVETSSEQIPSEYALHQNYPNPFNPSTTIKFELPASEFVTLKVYNLVGQEVATLISEQLNSGIYETSFDASNLSSGIYFYTLASGSKVLTNKMILIK